MKLPQTWVIKPTTVSSHHSSPVKHFFLWWVWAWIKFHHFSHKNQLLRSRRGMVVCNWEDLSILATWKRETNLTFLWKYRKNLRSRIPQVRSSKNSLSNTLRREVELNLYLLLRGRYQRLHLVPHYILIKISLLDKFDTQARSLLSSRHTSPFFDFQKLSPPTFAFNSLKITPLRANSKIFSKKPQLTPGWL